MISNMSSWAQGIIIAIIIGTIIQMLLPENKNKKYIKVVIGIYILFSILSPVVGKSINFNNYNLNEYVVENEAVNQSEEYIYSDSVKNTFRNKVIVNIKSQLKSKGYTANSIDIDLDDNCNILGIKIFEIYEYSEEQQENQKYKIVVNKIDTNINSVDINQKPVSGMATGDKNDLINYLSENYGLDKENIIIE